MMSYVAIFDLDETIINCKSLMEVYKAYCLTENIPGSGHEKFEQTMQQIKRWQIDGVEREIINRFFYQNFVGFSHAQMIAVIEKWLASRLCEKTFLNKSVIQEIKHHQNNGANVIIISGSFYDCVAALARELGIDQFICINLIHKEGFYTGEMEGIQTIGTGKLTALKQYLKENSLPQRGSYGYGDHISDLPFLNYVDHPVVVGEGKEITAYAAQHGWRRV